MQALQRGDAILERSTLTTDSGLSISKTMEKFVEKEERGDLKILGRAYVSSFVADC